MKSPEKSKMDQLLKDFGKLTDSIGRLYKKTPVVEKDMKLMKAYAETVSEYIKQLNRLEVLRKATEYIRERGERFLKVLNDIIPGDEFEKLEWVKIYKSLLKLIVVKEKSTKDVYDDCKVIRNKWTVHLEYMPELLEDGGEDMDPMLMFEIVDENCYSEIRWEYKSVTCHDIGEYNCSASDTSWGDKSMTSKEDEWKPQVENIHKLLKNFISDSITEKDAEMLTYLLLKTAFSVTDSGSDYTSNREFEKKIISLCKSYSNTSAPLR